MKIIPVNNIISVNKDNVIRRVLYYYGFLFRFSPEEYELAVDYCENFLRIYNSFGEGSNDKKLRDTFKELKDLYIKANPFAIAALVEKKFLVEKSKDLYHINYNVLTILKDIKEDLTEEIRFNVTFKFTN